MYVSAYLLNDFTKLDNSFICLLLNWTRFDRVSWYKLYLKNDEPTEKLLKFNNFVLV